MFRTADLGKDVKLRLLNAEVVRGFVLWVNNGQVGIETEKGAMPVAFDKISTVTWIGDHTSDQDTR